MSYISLSDNDIKEMLAKIGITSIEELFSSIPKDIKLNRDLSVPGPFSETEVMTFDMFVTEVAPVTVALKPIFFASHY